MADSFVKEGFHRRNRRVDGVSLRPAAIRAWDLEEEKKRLLASRTCREAASLNKRMQPTRKRHARG
jgi:hypothetical protein